MRKRLSRGMGWQYFLSYLTVMLLVMAAFMAYAYQSFYGFHSRILLDERMNRLELIRERQEQTLSDLVAIAGQIMSVTSDVPFDYLEDPVQGSRMTAQLAAYRATNDSIAGAYLRFYDGDFIYASNGVYSVERFVKDAMRFDKLSSDELLQLFNDTTHLTVLPEQVLTGYAFQDSMGQLTMVPVFVPVSIKGGLRCGTAMFLINSQTYNGWFNAVGAETADIYILSGDQLIASRQHNGIPLDTLLSCEEDTLTFDGQRYHLLTLAGNTFAYGYMMLVPDAEIGVSMSSSVQMLMLLAAVVGALGLLFIRYFVERRMKPIRLLYSMLSDREPSGNELIEIRDGVQRLIDENAAMTSQMESMTTLRKSEFVRRFLVGAFENEDEYLSTAESSQINVDMPCFVVAMLAKPSESDYELTTEKVNRLFDDQVHGASRAHGVSDRLVLIAFAQTAEMLFDFLDSKLSGLRACSTGITMAVSAVHHDYREGQRAYLEAENAFEMRFITGNAAAIRFDQLHGQQEARASFDPHMLERLRAALHAQDPARVSASLKEITRATRELKVSLFDFRCMYHDILNVVSREARRSGVKEEAVYDLFHLGQCLSLDDLDEMLHRVCSQLLSVGQPEPQADNVSPEMRKARQIIQRRFSEPELSVSAIAQELGMSDSRLSVEFKKAFRMTPLECITNARMQRAGRLLTTTDMPVKDIALECGYYDISGFNRRFKAHIGMTPQQYKQSGLSQQASAEQ